MPRKRTTFRNATRRPSPVILDMFSLPEQPAKSGNIPRMIFFQAKNWFELKKQFNAFFEGKSVDIQETHFVQPYSYDGIWLENSVAVVVVYYA